MKYNIKNASDVEHRIRLVPRAGASAVLPSTAVNPTLTITEDGEVHFCLSKYVPVVAPEISCVGALSHTGVLSFDGPVTFVVEGVGEFTATSEDDLIEKLKANYATYGLVAEKFKPITYDIIIPVSDAPGIVDGENFYPEGYLKFAVIGEDIDGNELIIDNAVEWNVYLDSMDYPQDAIRRLIHDVLYPDLDYRVADINNPQAGSQLSESAQTITVDIVTLPSNEDVESLTYIDKIASHYENIRNGGGPTLIGTQPYTMVMRGVTIDLSGVDPAAVATAHADFDFGLLKNTPMKKITGLLLHAPCEYTSAGDSPIFGLTVGATATYPRKGEDQIPSFHNACMTSGSIRYMLGAGKIYDDFEITPETPIYSARYGQPMRYEFSFSDIAKHEALLNEQMYDFTTGDEPIELFRLPMDVPFVARCGTESYPVCVRKLRLPSAEMANATRMEFLNQSIDPSRNGTLNGMNLWGAPLAPIPTRTIDEGVIKYSQMWTADPNRQPAIYHDLLVNTIPDMGSQPNIPVVGITLHETETTDVYLLTPFANNPNDNLFIKFYFNP